MVKETKISGKQKRFNSLMPLVDGMRTPKWIRCYDNGGTEKENGSIDRYTVVFTGHYTHKTGGSHRYVAMNGAPYSPQGFGQHMEDRNQIDKPSYGHLGKKIKFKDLPADCKRLVIDDYTYLWDIREEAGLPPEHKASVDPFAK